MKRTKFLWNNVYDLNTERGVMFIRFPCDDKVKLHHAVLTKKNLDSKVFFFNYPVKL